MTSINLMSLSNQEKKKFFDSFDAVITDCDGVLWHGKTPIPGAQDVIKNIVSSGKKIFYFTNNCMSTRKQYFEKCKLLGFEANEDEILCTAWLTAKYLKSINFNKKVYLSGGPSIKQELDSFGIQSIGVGPDNYAFKTPGNFGIDTMELDPDVGAVVVGYDFFFSYPKMMKACSYLNNPECLLLATNTDERFNITDSIEIPGPGGFVAAIENCSLRKADVMGKPSSFAIDNIIVPSGINPKRCLMIGDRCSTDIYFGNQRGLTTLMVETGINKYSDLEKFKLSGMDCFIPTFYTSSVADLLEIMKL